MTTVQIAIALTAAIGFILALIASSKLRIRLWVPLAAGVCGLALVFLSKEFLYRTTSLKDMTLGMALVCVVGPLLVLAVYLLPKLVKKEPETRNGRGAKAATAPIPLKAGKSPNKRLTGAQKAETLLLTMPARHIHASVAEVMPEAAPEVAPEGIPLDDGYAPEAPAEPEADILAIEPEPDIATAEPEDDRAVPQGEAPETEPEAQPEQAQALPEEEEDPFVEMEEVFRREKERLAREEALRQEREDPFIEMAEIFRMEKERYEREEERQTEREPLMEEEDGVKEEKREPGGMESVNEAQHLSQRIREERERVAMEERLRQEAETSAQSGDAAQSQAAPETAVEKAEEEGWEREAARMARELEERRREQEKAAEQERQWLEEMERQTREQEERRAEQEREEIERAQREREALEKRTEEAEGYLAKGKALLEGGAFLEAINWLEKAAGMDAANRLKVDANVAIIEALAALGCKAEALKKMQAMKAGLEIDAESKAKLGKIASRLIG